MGRFNVIFFVIESLIKRTNIQIGLILWNNWVINFKIPFNEEKKIKKEKLMIIYLKNVKYL